MTTLAPTAPRAQVKKLNLGATPAPDIDAIDNVIKDYSARNDVPRMTRPSEEKGEAPSTAVHDNSANITPLSARRTRKANPAPTSRGTVELPTYLWDALSEKAVKEKVTKRYLVLKAFKDAGYTVHDVDLFKDGRRES